MTTVMDRIFRAAKLDRNLYEEVEADKNTLSQALGVVFFSGLAAGIGAVGRGPAQILFGAAAALIGWFSWAALIYLIGVKLLPEPQTRSDLGELLRTIGFASAPGLIRVLGIFPGMAEIVFFVAAIWMFVAMVLAARQALDYQSTIRAISVVSIGWIVQMVILVFALSMMQQPSPGAGETVAPG